MPSLITFLYPLLNLWCFPPSFSINLLSPSVVIESVTIAEPGYSLRIITDINAIRASLLIGLPYLSTIAALSTSVSNIIPRSLLFLITAWQIDSIASLFSGFGIWFGKFPSGFKNWLPLVLAPSSSNTLLAKNPPDPLPASTIMLRPSNGLL